MKKEYDTSVKEAIERVMSVFSEYIKTTPYFDIVWSGKVGYIYISIDSCRGTVGDMDCLVIDSPEELLDKLLYEMAVDIMEEGGHDLNPVEASALERAEVARRLNVYLEQLPEYQDRISFVFERKSSSKIMSLSFADALESMLYRHRILRYLAIEDLRSCRRILLRG